MIYTHLQTPLSSEGIKAFDYTAKHFGRMGNTHHSILDKWKLNPEHEEEQYGTIIIRNRIYSFYLGQKAKNQERILTIGIGSTDEEDLQKLVSELSENTSLRRIKK